MNLKRLFVTFAILCLVTPLVSAAVPQAVLNSLKGKVEVKLPGAKTWVAAEEGQVLSPASTLSTGFDSSVVVVMDKTTVQVKPLTRMTIDKLVEESGTVKTTTFLRVGGVSASVKSAEGVKQDFKVQSPYSTASVRGTQFDFDGLKLKVREGLVAFILGRPQREAEEQAADDFTGAPDQEADDANAVPVGAGQEAEITVDFTGGKSKTGGTNDKSKLGGDTQGGATHTGPSSTKGSLTVSVKFPN